MKLTVRDKYFDVVLERDYDSFEEAEVLLDNCARYLLRSFNNETVAY